ncbi:MAG: succinate dehydrogenase assembly factor 2 [Pseudomonadales bacterium]|nr:succinate dehydrogenase assembly factor 2 [Pseudomonadales bacterium]MCP5182797.1 succinate dehydrogenase assembly factor 2 [Pseudomonadales bacterium]
MCSDDGRQAREDESAGEAHDRRQRVYWRSRRGMLELEFRLLPFVEACFDTLSPADQAVYADMLECEDWQLFDWLQGREEPDDPAVRAVVERIIAHGAMP